MYMNSSKYPDFNGCIPPADMNFYLIKTKELINREDTPDPDDLPGLRPPGYSLIDIDMWGESHINPQNFTIYQHQASVHYGILHVSPDPYIRLD
jgi:hypothetical protein